MTWRYETHTLDDIYSMMNDTERVHPYYDILKKLADKAYQVALYFKENGMNEDLIMKYLNGQLECDALCKFGLTASVLYPEDVNIEDRIHSYSHNTWLNELNRVKLQWTWKHPHEELEETQKTKFNGIVNKYKEIQQIALSYPRLP